MFFLKIKIKTLYIIAILIVLIIIFAFFSMKICDIPALASPSIKLPILMYHNILKDSNKRGKYVISPKEFEEDILYLKKEGYSTIVVKDLIDYVYKKKPLPQKPIMLTIDDGFSSNYTYILPILEKYNCKAVVSIVGEYVDKCTENPSSGKAYLNWEQVRKLVESPWIEIQNHSYFLHDSRCRKGSCKMKGESYEEYKKVLFEDLGKLQLLIKEKTGYVPTAFTYPYGFISKESKQILIDMGFKATLSCYTGMNYLSGNVEELYELKRVNRPSGINQEIFFKLLEK